nr:hypothetical protein Iba_chr04cCG14160 [Ipomoea batatas]
MAYGNRSGMGTGSSPSASGVVMVKFWDDFYGKISLAIAARSPLPFTSIFFYGDNDRSAESSATYASSPPF